MVAFQTGLESGKKDSICFSPSLGFDKNLTTLILEGALKTEPEVLPLGAEDFGNAETIGKNQ